MNIYEMAEQASRSNNYWLEHFAALVAAAARADERESFYGQDKPAECVEGCPPKQICDYCQIVAPVKEMILAARADEREAIAQMFEGAPALVQFAQNDQGGCLVCGFTPKLVIEAIRARGTT